MALFDKNNKNGNIEVVPLDKHIGSDDIGTAIKYESETPITDITPEVSGLPWTVDFYNQILNKNDVASEIDIDKPIATQSYREIKDTVIKLSSSIESVNSSELTGDGWIDIEDVVREGDIIVARLHNNRLAMLNITEVKNRSYELNTIYYITFKLLTFVDDDDRALYTNLKDKVATESVFLDPELATQTNSKIIDKSTYMLIRSGQTTIDSIMNMYINKYFSIRDNYFLLTIDGDKLIDPYLNDFILKFFEAGEYRLLNNIERYGGGVSRENYMTIYDGILGVSDIRYVSKLGFGLKSPGLYSFHNYNDFKYEVVIDGTEKINDKTYYVPENFYTEEPTEDFDKLLKSYIDTRVINHVLLNNELKKLTEYDYQEGYFRIPVLLVLLKLYLINPNEVV